MISDSEVDVFSINDNQLSTTLPEEERNFLILKLTFSILHDNLLYNANVSFQSF